MQENFDFRYFYSTSIYAIIILIWVFFMTGLLQETINVSINESEEREVGLFVSLMLFVFVLMFGWLIFILFLSGWEVCCDHDL